MMSSKSISTLSASSRACVTLDLIIKSLINSHDFGQLETKNWDRISRLVPGTTPSQCARRYEELVLLSTDISSGSCPTKSCSQSGIASTRASTVGENDVHRSKTVPNVLSGTGHLSKGNRKEKDRKTSQQRASPQSSGSNDGPMMVIHVCDEAKNLKQDFQCPRDLLIREMQYFAEYLSTDPQRWEDVDISVHCDVQIFDWLMKYVKRDTIDAPCLEPNNVISILISSDFLKMENLVCECVKYCHQNMSAIVATPCNMNCINEKLVNRISDLFSHSEADEVKDRKDKFRSKIFIKKTEKFFCAGFCNAESPENATTLFRCAVCKRLLTTSLQKVVRCLPSRMTVDRHGQLVFCHQPEATFDINEYLLDLKLQLKSWRDVYWHIWGTVNHFRCSRCKETFPCTDLGHCRYHPETAKYDDFPETGRSFTGVYPCCHQKALRFNPTSINTGCRVRDHVVDLTTRLLSNDDSTGEDNDTTPHTPSTARNKVYDDLLIHRDAVCVAFQREATDEGEQEHLDLFGMEAVICGSSHSAINIPSISSATTIQDDAEKTELPPRPAPKLQPLLGVDRQKQLVDYDVGFGESDEDETDRDSDVGYGKRVKGKKSPIMVDPQAILLDAPDFNQNKQSEWDSHKSMRWNQDAQRQEDQRRMKEICQYLTKLRLNTQKTEKSRHKEYNGGIFSRLECQMRANNNLAKIPGMQMNKGGKLRTVVERR